MKEREEKASEGGKERTGQPCERVIKSTPSVNTTSSCLIPSAETFLQFVKFP